MPKLTPSLARQLQGDLMKAAHAERAKRGAKHISQNDWHKGADRIAAIHGYANGKVLVSAIGVATARTPKAAAPAPTIETRVTMSRDDFINKLADELAEIILSRRDMRLAEDWREAQALNVEPRDMRHARKRLRERGWEENTRAAGFRYTPPPAQAEQVSTPVTLPISSDKNATSGQLGLLLDGHDRTNRDDLVAGLQRIEEQLGRVSTGELRIVQGLLMVSSKLDKLIELWT